VERDHGPQAEGAASFHTTRWTIIIRAAQNQPLAASVLASCAGCIVSALHVRSTQAAKAAGFLTPVGCHTWRATGITIYLEDDGQLEHAQQMTGHKSPRTTKLYDRTKDEITLSEVERIRL
jgi:hypothetical protein